MSATAFSELLQKKEPLCAELQEYLTDVVGLGQCLQHPLVYSVPHFPALNAMLNAQYVAKQEYIARAKRERKWSSVIMLHEKPYRWPALAGIASKLSDKEFWEQFGSVWTDSENIWQNRDTIRRLLDCGRPHRECIMDDDERKALADLPERVTIYRGHQRVNLDGWSWTLDPKKARWFANRWQQNGRVATRTIHRSEIIALLLGRNEQEVIYIKE
jgi:hypothetical protein